MYYIPVDSKFPSKMSTPIFSVHVVHYVQLISANLFLLPQFKLTSGTTGSKSHP
jgi:hypothetical protein